MLNERDKNVLERIIKYCDEIELTIKMFDDSLETHTRIPWARIKRMRNVAAHHYGKFDMNVLHDTIISDIPELKTYCQNLIEN